MISYLRYIYNPRDTVALKRIINTPKRNIGKDTIDKLDEYATHHNMTMHDVIVSLDHYAQDI